MEAESEKVQKLKMKKIKKVQEIKNNNLLISV